ncbi:MAG: asparagine synthase (glutamine-hydrolyzing) [Verrucomicrobiales bacterium]|nr:asparagine synthase (glutamine-hydrolyzing) [Verrucomicrobiales bacterium]
MCGIVGVINEASTTEEEVVKMIEKVRYRGIDEQGVERIGPAILGHCRLAVVDPENGMQPMTNEDGSVMVTFNGEIYNFVELREELKAKGHVFKSRCDTEVLVHLWEEEGEAMLSRLIGMYTFFIWDDNQKTGMLARDRQGIKPCFVADYKGGTVFASEMKSIFALPGFEREINDNALKEVFAFNYTVPHHTCFQGINQLEPGHYMLFKPGAPPVKKQYWEWPFRQEREEIDPETFEAMLDDAVRLQMRFDVDGGLYLSGGVDSSVVAAHLLKQWNRDQLDAVGLNFSESQYSEYEYSKEAASLLNINLKEALISWEMIPEVAEKVSYHAEQPHGDFSFFLFHILASRANRGGKIVMFTGDGPDEAMFGFGHNERYFHQQTRMNFSLRNYFDVICYMKPEMRAKLLDPDFEARTTDPVDRFEEILDPWRDLEPVEQIMAYECTSLMPGNNLVKGDRMGACWSTEGRAPFLDHRVTEAMVKLPVNQKFREGYGKYFLKNYALRKFPRQLIFKKKSMPTTPIGEWIKDPLFDWAHDLLSSNTNPRFQTQGMVDLLLAHQKGEGNYTRELRTLLMTQLWLRNFFN